jgi:predicted ATPase
MIARNVFAQAYAINDSTNREAYRTRCASVTAEDPHVAILSHIAVTCGYLGFVEQARSWMRQAFSEARELGHLYSLGMASSWASWIECAVGSPSAVRGFAEDAIPFSNDHGFPFWLAWGLIYRGWSMGLVGEPEEGYAWIVKGLSAHRATGSVVSTPFALTLLAEVCAKLGRTTEGLDHLIEAEQITEAANDRFHEAELHRVRGDVLSGIGDLAGAERSYQQAILVANRQSAKLFELRAAMSMARLWRDQGKRDEARALLAPVYGWFTEGFNTRDLKEAKALLDELAS